MKGQVLKPEFSHRSGLCCKEPCRFKACQGSVQCGRTDPVSCPQSFVRGHKGIQLHHWVCSLNTLTMKGVCRPRDFVTLNDSSSVQTLKLQQSLRAFYSWLEPESGLGSRCDGLTPVAPATASQDLYM